MISVKYAMICARVKLLVWAKIARRTMPAAHTLRGSAMSVLNHQKIGHTLEDTHIPPRRNMPATAILCLIGRCNFKTIGIGIEKMKRSMTTSVTAVAM